MSLCESYLGPVSFLFQSGELFAPQFVKNRFDKVLLKKWQLEFGVTNTTSPVNNMLWLNVQAI